MDGGNNAAQKDESAGWAYRPAGGAAATVAPGAADSAAATPRQDVLEWTASEFIAYDKSFVWYVLFFLVSAVIGGVVYLITRDVFSVVGLSVLSIIVAVAAGRKPRTLNYSLDPSGITAGKRFYSFSDFKSFALINEGPFWSVVFLPLKRFALPLSLYLAPDQEQKVADAIGRNLPLEQGELGIVEELMRRVRF